MNSRIKRRTQNLGALTLVCIISVNTLPAVRAVDVRIEEEIVVYGELRNLAIDDTALSVTVIAPNDTRQTAINHLEEVLNWAPNVNYASGGSRGRFIQIRGVGERGQFAEPLNPSVGLLLDGVDLSGIGTAATTFDVAQIEIFRGPQGTLYGANALAGLINVVTHEPGKNLSGSVTADAGNFGAFGLGAVLTGPLTEELGFRMAVREYTDDGFFENIFLGTKDTNHHDELTLRGKLRWQPSAATDLGLTLGLVDIDNGYDAFSLDNNRKTRSDQPGKDAQKTKYASLRLDQDLPTGRRIVGYISYADSAIDYGYDEDWTFDGFDPIGYSSTDRYLRDRQTTSYDARLLSGADFKFSGLAGDWVVGAFGLNQRVDLRREYTFAATDLESDYDVDRLAVYGELGLQLAPSLRLALGLRIERHKVDYADSEGVTFSPSDTSIGGRLVLEYATHNDNLVYATLTRGYKTGGANTDGSLPAELRQYSAEKQWNLELGYKGSYADNRGSLRTAAFLMLRDDVQASTSLVLQRADGSAEFIDLVANAAQGRNFGFEIETQFALTDKVALFGTLGLLSAEFQDFINGAGDDLDGRDQAQAPSYQFFIGMEYNFLANWFARLEIEGKDGFFFSDSHAERAPAYELLNFSVGYQGPNWHAKIWGRNLTDQDTFVRGFFFGNDPRDGYAARSFTQLGEPRRIGVSINLEF